MGELFDPSLFEESQIAEIKRCLEIGLLCTQFELEERPTMAKVLDMLDGKIGLGTPKQPEYTKERVPTSKGGGSHKVRGGKFARKKKTKRSEVGDSDARKRHVASLIYI
jgi:L1 cell adhesion molecule like protein